MNNYESYLSDKIKKVKPSGIRRFFDIANEMDDVISLSIGEPDFSTPWHVRDAGIRSLESAKTWYSPNRGFMELREEISVWLKRRYNASYQAQKEILVTVGGSEAIDVCIRSLVNSGDEVLVPEPSFVCYVPLTSMAGGVPVVIKTKPEDSFRLTAQALREKITSKSKLLILPYPNNPTGAVMDRQHLMEIAEVVKENNLLVLADEIYSELTYTDEGHICFASLPGMRERTILINGFSKAFAMTGWRLGFAAGPEKIIGAMTKLHQFAIMCAPSTAQYAAIEALRNGDEDILNMREQYNMRRRLMVDSFNKMGLHCFEPEGAFYVFPCIKSTGMTSAEFCEKLLYDQKVAVVPGDAFGESGEGFIRVSYSYSIKHITEALKRIRKFVNGIHGEENS